MDDIISNVAENVQIYLADYLSKKGIKEKHHSMVIFLKIYEKMLKQSNHIFQILLDDGV
ncbi:MAG: hypothetical protein ACLRHG_13770 [Coprococcus phoceensis]